MKIMLSAILVLSFNTLAYQFQSFDVFHAKMNELYSGHGDNNTVEAQISATAHKPHLVDWIEGNMQAKLHPEKFTPLSNAFASVKKCIFMQKGAYGEHISNQKADELTNWFLKEVAGTWDKQPDIYLVTNIEWDIVNNGCAILLVNTQRGESILIQGVSVD